MYDKRESGMPRDQSANDETMSKTFVGNIFSQLDGGSKRFKEKIIDRGDQSHEEICFRIFLFCGFYEDSTWDEIVAGLGKTPTWKGFDLKRYESILHQKSIIRREKIYYGGFQLVPPTVYFRSGGTLPHYAATLRFVMSLMKSGMPAKVLECRYAVDASYILRTAPSNGAFLSLNMICYLNDSPQLRFFYRNFASCGPRSRSYLQRIFGKSVINSTPMEEAGLSWLYENQWRYWARLGVDPPHAWKIGLRRGHAGIGHQERAVLVSSIGVIEASTIINRRDMVVLQINHIPYTTTRRPTARQHLRGARKRPTSRAGVESHGRVITTRRRRSGESRRRGIRG